MIVIHLTWFANATGMSDHASFKSHFSMMPGYSLCLIFWNQLFLQAQGQIKMVPSADKAMDGKCGEGKCGTMADDVGNWI